jgi:hypothetical protein
MNPYAIPSIISVVPFAFLSLAALAHNPEEKTSNRLLSLLCLNYAVFVAVVGLFHLSVTPETAHFWNKWPYLTLLPAVFLTLRYVLVISGEKEILSNRFIGIPILRFAAAFTRVWPTWATMVRKVSWNIPLSA